MRIRTTAFAAGTTAAVLLLSACSGNAGGGDPTQTSGGGETTAEGKVGVILPDTESSARWEAADRPYLEDAFEEAGVEVVIENAQGDASRMQTIADQMITQGVTVLAIVNLDSDSGSAIQQKAAQQGVVTIDYDRLTLGGESDYYISFDNTAVGRLQGEGLAECLGEGAKNIVYLNGSPTDNNATLFKNGAHEVLDKITDYKIVGEQPVEKWNNQVAATVFEQMFTQANGDVDGVLAANDGLGNAAISILDKNGLAGEVPVTGQDATVQGLQNILAGTQCMTVYKPTSLEAQGLVDTALAIINDEEPPTSGTTRDDEGDRDVPSILLEPIKITRDNVKDVVDDGYVDAAELCTGEYAAHCEELGIS